MSEVAMWVVGPAAALACQRWWYWKREAYRTRDAAFDTFTKIEDGLP